MLRLFVVSVWLCSDSAGHIICPYLATINRRALDFDFEKLCSVSLANSNVYACLVCGRYFQGRGRHSHAYAHALDAELEHHVFINLASEEIFCLPDGYQIFDKSLEDIKYNLHPKFKTKDLAQVREHTLTRTLLRMHSNAAFALHARSPCPRPFVFDDTFSYRRDANKMSLSLSISLDSI